MANYQEIKLEGVIKCSPLGANAKEIQKGVEEYIKKNFCSLYEVEVKASERYVTDKPKTHE